MTFLPIVERELRVVARLTATYRNRWLSVGIVTLVAMVMLLFGVFSGAASQVGAGMFWTLSRLALVFCLFEGVRKTADCLSEEKREGTLGLLFLTDLKGYDVVLGKLAATSLNSVYGLFSMLPVLALPLLLGGVTPAEFWRVALALLGNLLFSLCLGILISAHSRDERAAMGKTIFATLVIGIGPLFVNVKWVQLLSPIFAFKTADFATYTMQPRDFWLSLAIVQIIGCGLLAVASLTVVHTWQDRGEGPRARRWFRPWRAERMRVTADSVTRRREIHEISRDHEMLDVNPILWASKRGQRGGLLWILFAIVLLISLSLILNDRHGEMMVFFMASNLLINLVIKMRLAVQASYFFAEARRNNALEMLLVTPLSVHEIIEGQMQALKRIFLFPILAILTCQIGTLLLWSIIQSSKNGNGGSDVTALMLFAMGYLIIFALDVFAVTYAGMWYGLTCKKEGQAATKTILLVLVLPMLCYPGSFVCVGIPLLFIIPIIWSGTCSSKLYTHLREKVIRRFDSGNFVVMSKSAVVPVSNVRK